MFADFFKRKEKQIEPPIVDVQTDSEALSRRLEHALGRDENYQSYEQPIPVNVGDQRAAMAAAHNNQGTRFDEFANNEALQNHGNVHELNNASEKFDRTDEQHNQEMLDDEGPAAQMHQQLENEFERSSHQGQAALRDDNNAPQMSTKETSSVQNNAGLPRYDAALEAEVESLLALRDKIRGELSILSKERREKASNDVAPMKTELLLASMRKEQETRRADVSTRENERSYSAHNPSNGLLNTELRGPIDSDDIYHVNQTTAESQQVHDTLTKQNAPKAQASKSVDELAPALINKLDDDSAKKERPNIIVEKGSKVSVSGVGKSHGEQAMKTVVMKPKPKPKKSMQITVGEIKHDVEQTVGEIEPVVDPIKEAVEPKNTDYVKTQSAEPKGSNTETNKALSSENSHDGDMREVKTGNVDAKPAEPKAAEPNVIEAKSAEPALDASLRGDEPIEALKTIPLSSKVIESQDARAAGELTAQIVDYLLFDGGFLPNELPPTAFQVWSLEFLTSRVNEGGLGAFAHVALDQREIWNSCTQGLEAVHGEYHLVIFMQLQELLARDSVLMEALASDPSAGLKHEEMQSLDQEFMEAEKKCDIIAQAGTLMLTSNEFHSVDEANLQNEVMGLTDNPILEARREH